MAFFLSLLLFFGATAFSVTLASGQYTSSIVVALLSAGLVAVARMHNVVGNLNGCGIRFIKAIGPGGEPIYTKWLCFLGLTIFPLSAYRGGSIDETDESVLGHGYATHQLLRDTQCVPLPWRVVALRTLCGVASLFLLVAIMLLAMRRNP